jgi:hypothetical protein
VRSRRALVTVSVVVEIGEDAKVLSMPLADAVGPPVQIGVAVPVSVEVIMVRAVEPHVNRCRGGSQDTGQAGATHHHTDCVVAAQQVESLPLRVSDTVYDPSLSPSPQEQTGRAYLPRQPWPGPGRMFL